MAFDFKKEYKEFYMPKNKPEIVTVPKANYIAVRGTGDPNEEDVAWAVQTAEKKKGLDCSVAEFFTVEEGLCVQIMHIGSFNDEPETVNKMNAFIEAQGYENDFSDSRLHHEIYLSDARRVAPEKWKTVIRHPIRKK